MVKLRPFQREGVDLLKARGMRCLLADEMGLGKTPMTLVAIDETPGAMPYVVVCPAHLKYGWRKMAKQHVGHRAVVVGGQVADYSEIKDADAVIVNYDVLPYWWRTLRKINPGCVVADEAQSVKNPEAGRTQALARLIKGVKRFLALSGTPITNRPAEFWSVLNMIDPERWPNYYSFGHQYCGPRRNRYTGKWEFKGCTNAGKLNEILLAEYMIRRKKEDVLADLPAKLYSVVPLKMGRKEMREYETARDDVRGWLRVNYSPEARHKAERTEALAKVNILRQMTARMKLPHVIDWTKTFLESDRKLILFGSHKRFVREASKKFGKAAVRVDGSVRDKARQDAADRFNDDPKCSLYVGNIRAAGSGWSATACSDIAMGEFPWTPGEVGQCLDRAHGIGRGQEGIPTTAHFLVADGTIDSMMLRSLREKEKNIGRVMDGEDWDRSGAVFDDVIASLLKK